ncbi:hypothetical protein GJAV_G00201090 [Gymnothorax javanicus]|nr:hypothetical protein GJAV_G00201090 [Gymnothorax javanicus]
MLPSVSALGYSNEHGCLPKPLGKGIDTEDGDEDSPEGKYRGEIISANVAVQCNVKLSTLRTSTLLPIRYGRQLM